MRAGWLLGSLAVGWTTAHFSTGVAYMVVAVGFPRGGLALLPASAPPRSASMTPGVLWQGTVDFFRGKQGWGLMVRKGFAAK